VWQTDRQTYIIVVAHVPLVWNATHGRNVFRLKVQICSHHKMIAKESIKETTMYRIRLLGQRFSWQQRLCWRKLHWCRCSMLYGRVRDWYWHRQCNRCWLHHLHKTCHISIASRSQTKTVLLTDTIPFVHEYYSRCFRLKSHLAFASQLPRLPASIVRQPTKDDWQQLEFVYLSCGNYLNSMANLPSHFAEICGIMLVLVLAVLKLNTLFRTRPTESHKTSL